MAQNVTIAGASYPDVPSITVPKTDGGSAVFVDTSDADAAADDIRSGKKAYVNGELVTGTGAGGSGTAPLIVNFTLGDAVGGGFHVTPDVTADEIIEAAQSGRVVQACINLGDQGAIFLTLTAWHAGESGGEPTIDFDTYTWNQDELDATIFVSYILRYMQTGSLAQGWYFVMTETERLPPVGGGGNSDGKVLLAGQMEWMMSDYVLDDHINDLIDTKLGGIENGAY